MFSAFDAKLVFRAKPAALQTSARASTSRMMAVASSPCGRLWSSAQRCWRCRTTGASGRTLSSRIPLNVRGTPYALMKSRSRSLAALELRLQLAGGEAAQGSHDLLLTSRAVALQVGADVGPGRAAAVGARCRDPRNLPALGRRRRLARCRLAAPPLLLRRHDVLHGGSPEARPRPPTACAHQGRHNACSAGR